MWLRSDEAIKIADKARTKVWNNKRWARAEVYLNRSDGVQTSVSGSDRRYWDDDTKTALGIGGFLLELTLNRMGKKGVPAVLFN